MSLLTATVLKNVTIAQLLAYTFEQIIKCWSEMRGNSADEKETNFCNMLVSVLCNIQEIYVVTCIKQGKRFNVISGASKTLKSPHRHILKHKSPM